jgi:hypothetical protein
MNYFLIIYRWANNLKNWRAYKQKHTHFYALRHACANYRSYEYEQEFTTNAGAAEKKLKRTLKNMKYRKLPVINSSGKNFDRNVNLGQIGGRPIRFSQVKLQASQENTISWEEKLLYMQQYAYIGEREKEETYKH